MFHKMMKIAAGLGVIACAMILAISMSKPTSSPFSLRKCQGGLVLQVPTMSLPRFSTSLSLPCAEASVAGISAQATTPSPAAIFIRF